MVLYHTHWYIIYDADTKYILSTAINAISLALLDAGLPLHYVPSSASCAIKDDNILLDPNSYEEQV